MTASFWAGLATIPAVIAAALILWLLYSLASKAWDKLHTSMLYRVDVPKNRFRLTVGGTPPDTRPQYIDAANRFRDILLQSPRMHVLNGLGWTVLIVRDTLTANEARNGTEDTDVE